MEWLLILATLAGGVSALWFFKDKLFPPPDGSAKVAAELARLEAAVAALMKQTSAAPKPAASGGSAPAAGGNPLTARIAQLLDERRHLIDRLRTLAALRKVPVDRDDLPALLDALRLPATVHDAARKVLNFTEQLEKQSPADIEHADWLPKMAKACNDFLDMLIENARQPG